MLNTSVGAVVAVLVTSCRSKGEGRKIIAYQATVIVS